MTLRCCNTLLNYLTPMLVSCYLCKVLHDWLINYRALFIGFKQYKTLSQAVISPDVATHIKYSSTFEGFEDKGGRSISALLILDKLVFKQHL